MQLGCEAGSFGLGLVLQSIVEHANSTWKPNADGVVQIYKCGFSVQVRGSRIQDPWIWGQGSGFLFRGLGFQGSAGTDSGIPVGGSGFGVPRGCAARDSGSPEIFYWGL